VSGDLYVVIQRRRTRHFERQGSKPPIEPYRITFAQAALGAELPVSTLDSERSVKVPTGTQTGTVFRLKGQGMPILGGRGRGDLFVSVTVITPTSLSREQRRLLE
jgi:molecular chaperone DnaJ